MASGNREINVIDCSSIRRMTPKEYVEDQIALIVPTLDPGEDWIEFLRRFAMQTCKPANLLVIDSSSSIGNIGIARDFGFEIVTIPKLQFDHGGTRQMGVDKFINAGIFVFLTQDAFLAHPSALEKLIECFSDPEVGVAYGRQLPRPQAGPIEAHSRLFNYPATSGIRSMKDVPDLGLKTTFCSNSFAAYRGSSLRDAGGFPSGIIFGEDMYTAARILMSGWKIVYCGDAPVYHSHPLSPLQEFRRYFDLGVSHSRNPWLLETFGKAEGEGKRFVMSEMKYLLDKNPLLLLSAGIRTLLKLFGYKLGALEAHLPAKLKGILAMNKRFWAKEHE